MAGPRQSDRPTGSRRGSQPQQPRQSSSLGARRGATIADAVSTSASSDTAATAASPARVVNRDSCSRAKRGSAAAFSNSSRRPRLRRGATRGGSTAAPRLSSRGRERALPARALRAGVGPSAGPTVNRGGESGPCAREPFATGTGSSEGRPTDAVEGVTVNDSRRNRSFPVVQRHRRHRQALGATVGADVEGVACRPAYPEGSECAGGRAGI